MKCGAISGLLTSRVGRGSHPRWDSRDCSCCCAVGEWWERTGLPCAMMENVGDLEKRFRDERVAAWRAQLEQLDTAVITDAASEGVRRIEMWPGMSPEEIAEVDQMNAVEVEYGAKLDALWSAANLVNGKAPSEERVAKLSPERIEEIMRAVDEFRDVMAELRIERELDGDGYCEDC